MIAPLVFVALAFSTASAALLPAKPRATRPSALPLSLRGGELEDVLPPELPPSDLKLIEDEQDLAEALEEAGSRLVAVDFFATWCGPCKKIAPVLEQLARKYGPRPGHPSSGMLFCKVDVDASRELAQAQEIKSMPTIHFFRNGVRVHSIVGADTAALRAFIKQQTLHPVLRALSGEAVVATVVTAYLAWSWRLAASRAF